MMTLCWQFTMTTNKLQMYKEHLDTVHSAQNVDKLIILMFSDGNSMDYGLDKSHPGL